VLVNDTLRLYQHFSELVVYNYSFGMESEQTQETRSLLKREAAGAPFRNILRFPSAATKLAQLLRLGGVWELPLEGAYRSLYKMRVASVWYFLYTYYKLSYNYFYN
jgi:hypothetical protein